MTSREVNARRLQLKLDDFRRHSALFHLPAISGYVFAASLLHAIWSRRADIRLLPLFPRLFN